MLLITGRKNQMNGVKPDLIIPSTKQLQQQALGHPLSNSVTGTSSTSHTSNSQTLLRKQQQKLKAKKIVSSTGSNTLMTSGNPSRTIHPNSVSSMSFYDEEYYDDSILDPNEDTMIVLCGEKSDDIIYQHIGYGRGDAYNFESILEEENRTINCFESPNDDESERHHKNDRQIRQCETMNTRNMAFLPFPIPCIERSESPLMQESDAKIDSVKHEKVKVDRGRHASTEVCSPIKKKVVQAIKQRCRERSSLDGYGRNDGCENNTDDDDDDKISLLRGNPVSSIDYNSENHRKTKISMIKIFSSTRVQQSSTVDCPENLKKPSSFSPYWMEIPNKGDDTDDSTTKDNSSSGSSSCSSNDTADGNTKKKPIAFDMGYLVDVPCQYVEISVGNWEYVNEYFSFTSLLCDDDDEGTRISL